MSRETDMSEYVEYEVMTGATRRMWYDFYDHAIGYLFVALLMFWNPIGGIMLAFTVLYFVLLVIVTPFTLVYDLFHPEEKKAYIRYRGEKKPLPKPVNPQTLTSTSFSKAMEIKEERRRQYRKEYLRNKYRY